MEAGSTVAVNTIASSDNRANALPKLCAALASGSVKRIYGPSQIALHLVRDGRRDLALRLYPFVMKASAGVTDPADCTALLAMIEILRDPAKFDIHDWVLLDTEVRAGTAGYLSQTSVLHGLDGHAYAVSHQTVAVFG